MNTTMNKLALAMGALMMTNGAMAADSGSTTMGVTASIVDACALGNTVALAFGELTMLTNTAQSPTASDSSGGGTFDAICTKNTLNTPKLKFTSANTEGTNSFRLVGADNTSYIVYTLATVGGTAIAHATDAAFNGFNADGVVKNLTIKGSITGAEKAGKKVQAYSDTITIQASYNLPQ